MDMDANPLGEALDLDLRDACVLEPSLDEPTNVQIFMEEISIALFGGKPFGIPGFNDSEP